MPYKSGGDKPSEELYSLLMGNTKWEDAPESIRSWARLYLYQAAAVILNASEKSERRKILDSIPAEMRPHVEAEALRVWNLRKDGQSPD